MGISIVDKLNAANGTNAHTIVDALKAAAEKDGITVTGTQTIADTIEEIEKAKQEET